MRSLILVAILVTTAYGADFTTYVTGADPALSPTAAALATDPAGNTFVTGTRAHQGGTIPMDVFVTKLDPAGNIVLTTYFGGQCCSMRVCHCD